MVPMRAQSERRLQLPSVSTRRQQRTASPLSAKLKTVGDGQQNGFDTLVAGQLAIELVDGATTCLVDPRCPQPPAPQHVVKQNQTVGSHARKNQFVVRVVFFFGRSEEHTSELQSQSNLVCRLL